jgi:anti-sigma B factor antagonist
MFDVRQLESGGFSFSGRLDASQTDKADLVLKSITKSAILDLQDLDYISSAGLGILLACQKRLKSSGNGLTLKNLNNYIKDIFKFTGFDKIFEIQ